VTTDNHLFALAAPARAWFADAPPVRRGPGKQKTPAVYAAGECDLMRHFFDETVQKSSNKFRVDRLKS
jgi:hypothetical protein